MKKSTLVVAGGLLSALAATPVLAQTNSNAAARNGSSASAAGWMTQPSSNQWLGSHLKGVNVYNDQNQKLGSIDELIMDRQGKVQAAVLDVGGFLGMGVHRVAVPFEQLHFSDRSDNINNRPTADATRNPSVDRPLLNNNTANAPGNPTSVGPANTGVGSSTANTATSTRNDVAANGAGRGNGNVPDHATLNMTADQLKAAPEFRYNS